ncbi:MAG: O-antigen ligase family protein [Bacteriovorax sp.]|nr:O-antigen ligase family protein [Bacteriovorax sp.]
MMRKFTLFHFLCFISLLFALSGQSSFFSQEYFVAQSLGLFLLSLLLITRWTYNSLKKIEFISIVIVASIANWFSHDLNINIPLLNFFICGGVFLSLVAGDSDEFNFWKKAIISISLIQALIVAPTLIPTIKAFFPIFNNEPLGTVGNSDFLAILFASSIFYALELKISKSWRNTIILIFSLSLLATMSKGTILVFVLILLFKRWPRVVCYSLFPIGLIFTFLFSHSLFGRLQLWITALKIWKNNFWFGSGTGQFSSAYFNANKELMNLNWYKNFFGAWSSQVTDAHNLLLHWSSEWGVIGLIASVLFLSFLFLSLKKSKEASKDVILLSLIKSLYTVLIPTIQGLLTLCFALSDANKENSFIKKSKVLPAVCLFSILTLSGFMFNFVSSQYFLKRGLILSKVGYFDSSLENLMNANLLYKNDTNILLTTAYVNSRLGNCDQATAEVNIVSNLRQDMDSFKRGGHILFDCKKYDKALRLFSDIHLVFPEHRTTTMKMAWIYYFLWDNTTAKKLAREVLKLQPRRKSFSDERNLNEANDLLKLITNRHR